MGEKKKNIISQFTNNDKFSEEMVFLLDYIEDDLSKELPVLMIDIDYFVLATLNAKATLTYRIMEVFLDTVVLDNINESYWEYVSTKTLTAVKPGRKAKISPDLVDLSLMAEEEMKKSHWEYISGVHFILALLNKDYQIDGNRFSKVIKKIGKDYDELFDLIYDKHNSNFDELVDEYTKLNEKNTDIKPTKKSENSNKDTTASLSEGLMTSDINAKQLSHYYTDLNDLAERDMIEPLIGREDEMNELMLSLGKKRKSNVILIGDDGVGKTAIAENLAVKIARNDVPHYLSGKRIMSLNMTALMSGTTLRGQFEERAEMLFDFIERYNNILFIDNIGDVLSSKQDDYGIAAILANKLNNGRMRVIGTCDYKSYKKVFEKKATIARLFRTIDISKVSRDDSVKILNGLKKGYEDYYHVVYDENAVNACVDLAQRYISERNLPDSAIDVMSDAGIHKSYESERNNETKELKTIIDAKQDELKSLKKKKDYDAYDVLLSEVKRLRKDYNEKVDEYERNLKDNPLVITEDDIKRIISVKTRVPVEDLTVDGKKSLVGLNERMKGMIIGQDEAVDTICQALKRNRLGLRGNGCLFSGFLLGGTGVGKTMMAKTIAKMLFGGEDSLVRFDMSEYSDKSSVSKLIGSNPGYVGYEDGGLLTEKIKHNKYCVLLVDEIEKADPEVYNIFLQVLDEGFLTDSYGMRIDFKNVVVLFTSNVGVRTANEFGKGIGFSRNDDDNNKRRITERELKSQFPPEFINRIDEIVYFNSLGDDDLRRIIKLEMDDLLKRLGAIGYGMEYDDAVVDYILGQIKDEKEYGARPIKRAIRRDIENMITDDILVNEKEKGYVFKITEKDGTLAFAE